MAIPTVHALQARLREPDLMVGQASTPVAGWHNSLPDRILGKYLSVAPSPLPRPQVSSGVRKAGSMQIKNVLAEINRMQRGGVISRNAIGGAVGARFYLEPAATLDIDIFVGFEARQPSDRPQPSYEYLTGRARLAASWSQCRCTDGAERPGCATASAVSTSWSDAQCAIRPPGFMR